MATFEARDLHVARGTLAGVGSKGQKEGPPGDRGVVGAANDRRGVSNVNQNRSPSSL